MFIRQCFFRDHMQARLVHVQQLLKGLLCLLQCIR